MESYLGAGAQILDHRSDDLFDRSAILSAVAIQAVALESHGVSYGSRVALGHGQGAAFVADLLAIWSLGATALVVSPSITRDERANVAASVEPGAWIAADTATDACPLIPPADLVAGTTGAPRHSSAKLDDIALIMMTSGTTGRPKGVMLTHRAVLARLSLNLAFIGAPDLPVSLNVLPMHFGHGLIGNCLTPLFAGARLVLWPEPGAGISGLAEAIDAHRVTFMSSVPALWQAALRLSPPPRHASLRRVHVGSAPLSATLWRRIIGWCGTRRVVNMYGMTECCNWIGGESAENAIGDDELVDGMVGRPWGGKIGILAGDGTVQTSDTGEVVVSSASQMAGYHQMPDESERGLAHGWLRTGDIGRLLPDGRLQLIGRAKHEINRRGIKIPAEEIDLLFERHPDVAEACAFALDDPLEGEIVAVAVVARAGAEISDAGLAAWCAPKIRREAVPRRFFVLDRLARNERGKLDRDRVRAACMR